MMKNLKKLPAKASGMLFVLLALFASCKKTEISENIKSPGPEENRGISTNAAADGKNDLLGYGYDVTGEFANSSAAKFSVINIDKLKAEQPTRVEWDLSSKREGVLTAGENAASYLEKITAKLSSSFSLFGIGKLLLFKGSINSSYADSEAFSSKYVYSSYSHKIQQKRVKLNATNAMLRDYLTPSFASDVASESPAYIVNRYGTHVLSDIILGAKLEVLYRSETTKSDRTNASAAGVDVGVKAIFSINTGYTYDYSSTIQNFFQTLHYKTIGGEPSTSILGNTSLVSAAPPTVNISTWENSSNLNNAEMIDIVDNGLIPIWELIADPIKSEAVKNYVIQYLKDNQAKLIPINADEGKLIRTLDQKIYWIVGGEARHIRSWSTFTTVFTSVTDCYCPNMKYQIGPSIGEDTGLIRDKNDSKVYFREGNYLRHILSVAAANKYNLKIFNNGANIKSVNGVSGYIIGAPLF